MKTKLLKQVRKRFKILHNQKPSNYIDPLSPTVALVYDEKGILSKEMRYIDRLVYENLMYGHVSSPSLAERLVMELKNMGFVIRHRNRKDKRKNLTFKNKYFK